MSKLELHNLTQRNVTEVTYSFTDENGRFYYKEWLDEDGTVIDSILRDKGGYQIDDPELYESVQNFVTEYENGK